MSDTTKNSDSAKPTNILIMDHSNTPHIVKFLKTMDSTEGNIVVSDNIPGKSIFDVLNDNDTSDILLFKLPPKVEMPIYEKEKNWKKIKPVGRKNHKRK